MADLYLCWNQKALYVGLYAQDVVETAFYRNSVVPEEDRAEWVISPQGAANPIRCRIGAGMKPYVNLPEVRIVNSSGVNLNVRNFCAVELPARHFGREQFRDGDVIELSSTFLTQGRGYRTEWSGRFALVPANSRP